MIETTILGSGGEVGRSSILVDTGVEKFLLDYGINVQDLGVPIKPDIKVDAVIPTHAHMDHSGMLPELYKRGFSGKMFMTPPTLGLALLLLKDSIKVQKKRGVEPYFLPHDIKKFANSVKMVGYRQPIKFRDSTITLIDAGHIPGSAMILIEIKGKKILYTGDLKFESSVLVNGADERIKDIDLVISESTYNYKDHPDRKKLADKLREQIQEVIYNNGIVLLPSFAVGRTQEMLMLVHDLGFPVYVDGMGKEATRIALSNPEYLKDAKKLREAFGHAHKIERGFERKRVLENPCVVICTSGMLNGGPIHTYIKKLYKREDCSIILSGYQVEKTIGRHLMDTRRFPIGGEDTRVYMDLQFFDFSAHCGRGNLIKFFKKINPGKVCLVHGAETHQFAKELRGMGFDALAPKNGDRIKL